MAVAGRNTGKYSMEPNKKSIISWLDWNGFNCFKWDKHGTSHTKTGKSYMVGPCEKNRVETNWISIHTDKMFELIIWFDEYDRLKSAETRTDQRQFGRHIEKEDIIDLILFIAK